MDVIFALAYIEKVSPVAVSLRKDIPPAGSPEAELILGLRIPNNDEASGGEVGSKAESA